MGHFGVKKTEDICCRVETLIARSFTKGADPGEITKNMGKNGEKTQQETQEESLNRHE